MSSKNAAVSASQHRGHGGDTGADSTYANSDAISSFYMQQKPAAAVLMRPQPTPQPQVVPSSVSGEYASLCIAMSAPVDPRPQNNSMTTSQARLRPALFRLSEGFDYDLANPAGEQTANEAGGGDASRANNGSIPRNRNSLSLNSADLDNASAMLEQVTSTAGVGPVTYGEYASTAIGLEPLMVESATGFADAGYTSEEDEVDEQTGGIGMSYRSPPPPNLVSSSLAQTQTTNSMAPIINHSSTSNSNNHNHNNNSSHTHRHHHNSRPQARSLPVPVEASLSTSNNNNNDENRPSNFSCLIPSQTLSTFSSSGGGANSNASNSNSNGHSNVLPSRVIKSVKSEPPPPQPASPASNSAGATAGSSSLTTAGSGLQALKVRRQLIEAALSGGSTSVASPVVPSVPAATNNGTQPSVVESNNNSNNNNSQQQNTSSIQNQPQRKDVGHLDMSQYSNLEGKVLVGGKTAVNVAAKSSSFQEPTIGKQAGKVTPASQQDATSSSSNNNNTATNTATSQHRNKILTSSSRKGRPSGAKEQGVGGDSSAREESDPMPPLPITELSERLAREAKAIAGRRSLVLGANNPVLSTSTTASSGRQANTLPSNQGAMSQSMHVGPTNNASNVNNNTSSSGEASTAKLQTMPTMLDVCRHHGQIRWTKIIENGKRIKKAWTIYYCVFINLPPRLYFFKDEKSAAKSPPPAPGNLLKPHQELCVPSPWSVCSQADMPPKLQFTRRKNVLFLAAPILPNCNNTTSSSTSNSNNNNNSNNSNSNSSPPLSDGAPGFPDVAFGYLIEAPNTEQAEIWLRQFLQSGGLSKYSAIVPPTPSSPPALPREATQSVSSTGNTETDPSSSSLSSSTQPQQQANNQNLPEENNNNNNKALSSGSTTSGAKTGSVRSTARQIGGGGGAKGSLMKLLTGFFKRRPTMEHLKKKGYIRDTIFGSSLENICRRERSEVPAFVTACVTEIELRGLETDGLYRTSGNLAQVQKLRCMVDQGQAIAWDKWEIAVLTGALKMFFRELREPLITTDVYEKLTEYATRPDLRRSLDPASREAYLRRCLAMLPAINFSTARYLFGHFVHVLEHSAANRMELQSLAIVVAPNLMAPHTDVRSVAAHALLQKYIAEDLIQFYYNLFFTPPSSNDYHYANNIATTSSNNSNNNT